MKSKKWIILTILSGLLIAGCQKNVPLEDMPELKKEVYLDLTKESITYYLYIGSDQCPYCQAFQPKLEQALKHSEPIYYLNADKADDRFKEFLAATYHIESIPYLVKIQQEEVIKQLSYHSDLTSKDIQQFLTH